MEEQLSGTVERGSMKVRGVEQLRVRLKEGCGGARKGAVWVGWTVGLSIRLSADGVSWTPVRWDGEDEPVWIDTSDLERVGELKPPTLYEGKGILMGDPE